MSTWSKTVTLVLIFLFIIAFSPIVTSAQNTYSYGGGVYGTDSGLNYCSFLITSYSPNDQITYTSKMLLKFNITWTTYPRSHFPDVPPDLYGYYAYSLDNGPLVEVMSNQSVNDVFYQRPKNNFTINPSFSYLVDISNLEKGNHNIVINASLYHYPPDHLYFNMTTTPYKFLVGEQTATPTASPTPTATSALTPTPPQERNAPQGDLLSVFIPLTVGIIVLAVILLLIYGRHQKTTASISV